jgi:hypothetical protein
VVNSASPTSGGLDLVLSLQPEPPRRRHWRRWLFLLLVLVLLACAGLIWLRDMRMTPHHRAVPAGPPPFEVELLDVAPGNAIPIAGPAVPADLPGPADPRTRWINTLSAHTDIPRRALSAYVRAEAMLATSTPSCRLAWTTLAGIGWVESRHGEYHGDTLLADGTEQDPIIGPALDGSPGRQRIADTDHGTLDQDPVWDHALGPMQFLPSTWAKWGLRASGDGKPADPQDIDDAALTAGRYLCASGGDLGTPAGWWKATFVYNNSVSYGQTVFSGANAYALASRAVSAGR